MKTEPGADVHQANNNTSTSSYYRLSPSPPTATGAPVPAVAQQQQQQQQHPFVNVNVPQHPSFSPTSAFDSQAGADGCSPVNYSPSSPAGYASCGESGSSSSSGVTGAYNYPPPLSNNRKLYGRPAPAHERGGGGRENGYHHQHHRYDDVHLGPCPCLSNPAAGHSFVNLARQLEAVQSYLQQLPEHNQHTHCVVHRRIQELRAILQ